MFSDGLFSRTGLPKLSCPRGHAGTVGSGTVILSRNQKLVDFQIFGVDDFKLVSRVNQKIGAFWDFAQGIHHKASDGFVVFRIGKHLRCPVRITSASGVAPSTSYVSSVWHLLREKLIYV